MKKGFIEPVSTQYQRRIDDMQKTIDGLKRDRAIQDLKLAGAVEAIFTDLSGNCREEVSRVQADIRFKKYLER